MNTKCIFLRLFPILTLLMLQITMPSFAQTFHTVNGPMGVVNTFSSDMKGNVYLASESRGVYVSSDKGKNWKKLGGNTIGVGEVDAFCYSDSGRLVIATQQGGIKYWNGSAWIALNNGLPKTGNLYPSFKTIVSDSSGHFYAGAYGYNTQRGGAYFYDGTSWNNISASLVDTNIYCMAISPSGTLYAGTDGGGVYSYDGASWKAENTGLTNLHINCLVFDSKDTSLFAGTRAGVFSLNNNSSSWKNKDPAFKLSVLSIAFDPSLAGRIFLGLGSQLFERGPLYGSIRRSDDNGDTWINTNFNVPTLRMAGMIILDDGTILAGAQGIFNSTDHGTTWVKSNAGFDAKISNFLGNGLAFNSKNELYFGSNYGMFKTMDEGQNWRLVDKGLNLPLISCLVVDSFDNILAGALALRKGYLLPQANLYISKDDGMQWDTVKISNDDNYTSIAIAPNGDYFCTHGFGANPPSATIIGSSLAISKDHGLTWQDLKVSNAGKGFSVAVNSKGHIYYGGELNGVYLSTDGGLSFKQNIDTAIYGNVGPMAISPSDDIFTCGYGLHHIYFSDSSAAGMPFTNMQSSSFPNYTAASCFLFDDYGKLFTGTRGGNISGLYSSLPPWNANTTFLPNASVGPVRVISMKWDKEGYLWLLSNGFLMKSDSILKFDPQLTSIKEKDNESTYLLHNYPNPFTNSTTIEFSIINNGMTKLSLYDEKGSLIKYLLNSELTSGTYQYMLDSSSLPQGVFIVKLEQARLNCNIKLMHF